MTTINLPGQMEVPLVVDHAIGIKALTEQDRAEGDVYMARQIAKLLRQYEERPTSETWIRIQALAAEILK
ncbi:hypothetical protein D9M71_265400 [compost metagenome]